jgi:hypothetical protein
MRFQFRERAHAAENHITDFEIVFEEGALCGLKLVGGSLWRSRTLAGAEIDRVFVTLPARRLHGHFYDLLRSASRDRHILSDFKARVVSEYHAHQHEQTRVLPSVEAV